MKTSKIGFNLVPADWQNEIKIKCYFAQNYTYPESFIHFDGKRFILVEDDDFEPIEDWYSSECVLNMFEQICDDLRKIGVTFDANIYLKY